jgi:iron complex transport system permease protein
VFQLRSEVVLLSSLVGAALAAAGATYQAILRNPLADPYLLGVSSGAALGATVSFLVAPGHWLAVLSGALLGAAAAASLVYLLAGRAGFPPQSLILAGVMVSSFASALVLLLDALMDAPQLQGAILWTMGSLASPPPGAAWWMLPATLAGLALVIPRARVLDLLSQGEETAASLGVEVEREKRILFGAACLLAAVTVAAAGLIGFVGLVVPHAVRLATGPGHARLLAGSALAGGAFLLLADVAARVVVAPAELPVGVVTALVGAPLFLALLAGRGRGRAGW